MSSPPAVLYHYTSAEGLLGMVQNNALWATQVQYMNDEREWHHAVDLGRQILKTRAHSALGLQSDMAAMLYEVMGGKTMSRTFAFSLTEKEDLLSQWRGYCPTGGYAIGLKTDLLVAQAARCGFTLRQCVYEDSEKRRAIEEIVLRKASALTAWPLAEAERVKLVVDFVNEVRVLAEVFKDSSFEEESEWRLVGLVPAGDARSRWRTRGGLVVPYAILEMGIHSLVSEILIGPKVDKELAYHSVDFLFRSNGAPVPIRNSKSTLV